MPSSRANKLAASLQEATKGFVALIGRIPPHRWNQVPAPGIWSVGKEAEHVAEALVYHQWIVRLTIGENVGSRRPALERAAMTTELTPQEAAALFWDRTAAGVQLISALTEAQLRLPTRPPRARGQTLGETIEQVLIDHVRVHQAGVEKKLAGLGG